MLFLSMLSYSGATIIRAALSPSAQHGV